MEISIDESPAVKALGSLFKLTQVHLWDDGVREELSKFHRPIKSATGVEEDSWRRDHGRRVEEDPWRRDHGRTKGLHSLDRDSKVSKQIDGSGLPPSSSGSWRRKTQQIEETKRIPSQQEITSKIRKYWCQRYILFSRFDRGIKMDEEGWYSVTPEVLAKHHAIRCGRGRVVDLFTGVGGNAIQFAKRSMHVTAIDIDPTRLEYARQNAAVYEVDRETIDFINGDSLLLGPKLRADTVFMSPPWGGPSYSQAKKFDMNTMLKPRDGQFLFNIGKMIAPKIVMFLPRNVDINQLAEIALSADAPWSLEVEKNYLNGRLKAITAYFTKSEHDH